jgi:putative tricarboxylic transport membrane protein
MFRRALPFAVAAAFVAPTPVLAEPDKPECIAPANPGGGFDLTCRIVIQAFAESKGLKEPMRVTFMPGGIGAVAINAINAQQPTNPNLLIAISSGSALNMAIGKFGKYSEKDVRWIAAFGADFGALFVKADSPFKSLKDLMAAFKADPSKVPIGAGGSVGSQDWMKAALVAKAAGVDPRQMRFVAFDGGGSTITALLGGHVAVASGDASEAIVHVKAGKMRVLAVMSAERLPGDLKDVPTAKEQGVDLLWTTWRGVYAPPKISDAAYKFWIDAFGKLVKTKEFEKARDEKGLYPFVRIGADFDKLVADDIVRFKDLAKEAGLTK